MHLQLRASRYAGDYILSSHTCCSIIHGKRKVFPLRRALHSVLLPPPWLSLSLSLPIFFHHYTRDPKFKLLFRRNVPYNRDIFRYTVLISQIDANLLIFPFRQDESYLVSIGSIKPQLNFSERSTIVIFKFPSACQSSDPVTVLILLIPQMLHTQFLHGKISWRVE